MSVAVHASRPIDDPFSRVQEHTCANCGSQCGHAVDEDGEVDKRRIADLESQISVLTEKATSAGRPACIVPCILPAHPS